MKIVARTPNMQKKLKMHAKKNALLGGKIILPVAGSELRFRISKHAKSRGRERTISEGAMEHVLKDVAALLPNAIATRSNAPEVVIPDPGRGAALLVALDSSGGTIVTVLDYPGMDLPNGVKILDRRKGFIEN